MRITTQPAPADVHFNYRIDVITVLNLDGRLHAVTTLTYSHYFIDGEGMVEQGTGFFYCIQSQTEEDKLKGLWTIDDIYLITNRHCVLPTISKDGKEVEIAPDSFTFYMRGAKPNSVYWDPVVIPKQELLARAKFHKDPLVDVAAIQVEDKIVQKIKTPGASYLNFGELSKHKFAGDNNINVEIAEDILVIGYPEGFYDEKNLFPIVKDGIIASSWGTPFEGKPYFLISARLFEGSSGSLVISKPTHWKIGTKGQAQYNAQKMFALLGIYSGQEFRGKETNVHDMGRVWYAYLIEEIIQSGVPFKLPV